MNVKELPATGIKCRIYVTGDYQGSDYELHYGEGKEIGELFS